MCACGIPKHDRPRPVHYMLARSKNNIGMGGRGGGGRFHWYEVYCSLVNVSLSCLGRGGGGDCDRVIVCPCQCIRNN